MIVFSGTVGTTTVLLETSSKGGSAESSKFCKERMSAMPCVVSPATNCSHQTCSYFRFCGIRHTSSPICSRDLR